MKSKEDSQIEDFKKKFKDTKKKNKTIDASSEIRRREPQPRENLLEVERFPWKDV